MRTQHLWATRDFGTMENFRKHAHANLNDLIEIGIEPSHPHEFLAHDMSPSWRFQINDDRGLIDYYWHELGLDRLWGEWPANPTMIHALQTEPSPNDYASWCLAVPYSKHPYIQFAQLVGEVTTGRNCIIRGQDHKADEGFADAFYPLIAKKHYGLAEIDRTGKYTPCQYFMPHIHIKGVGKISSSSGPGNAGFYIKDVLAAKISSEKLFAYLGKVLFGSIEVAERVSVDWSQQIPVTPETQHLRPMPQAGARSVMERISSTTAYIDAEDWQRFLRTGNVMP